MNRNTRDLASCCSIAVVAAMIAAVSYAEPADTAAAKPSVAAMEAKVRAQEAVVAGMNSNLYALDAGIEAKITMIVNYLSSVKDSDDSGTEVLRTKREVMESLGNTIQFYKQERANRLAALQTPAGQQTTQDLALTASRLDERIDKRVDQMVKLSTSLMQYQELQRYESARNHGYKDAGNVRAVGAKADEVKREFSKKIDETIDDLQREVESLNLELASARTDEEKQQLKARIDNDAALLEHRKRQRDRAFAATEKSEAALSLDDAVAVMDKLSELTSDMRQDYRDMMRIAYERDRARAVLNRMNKEFESAKKAAPKQ